MFSQVISERYLEISLHEIGPLADAAQLPFWQRDWISPDLKALLFPPSAVSAGLRTYFLVDGAKFTEAADTVDLDEDLLGVPVVCLFQGQAAETYTDSAPYLLDITLSSDVLEGAAPPPYFHKSFFGRHADKGLGIFILTHASIQELRRHFRALTKLRCEGSANWHYFRFWDPIAAASPHFDFIADRHESCEAWFVLQGAPAVERLVVQDYRTNTFKVVATGDAFAPSGRGAFQTFTHAERDHIAHYTVERRCYDTAIRLKEEHPTELAGLNTQQLQARLMRCAYRMRRYGIRQQEFLQKVFLWDLICGEEFETRRGFEPIAEILEGKKREPIKFEMLCARMAQIRPDLTHGRQ